jgi:hypothetical protein
MTPFGEFFLLTDSSGGSPLKNFVKHKKNYFFAFGPLTNRSYVLYCNNKTMKTRNIKHSDGKGESFAVSRHIILRNFWEYYVEEPDENGITFGFVMGFENEWGSVDYNEIKPYIISEAKGTALDEVMAPAGYVGG